MGSSPALGTILSPKKGPRITLAGLTGRVVRINEAGPNPSISARLKNTRQPEFYEQVYPFPRQFSWMGSSPALGTIGPAPPGPANEH